MSPILQTRQETFARETARGRSFREAAIAAGYSPRSATSIGSQLAKHPRVAQRIAELRERNNVLQGLGLPITAVDQCAPVVFFIPRVMEAQATSAGSKRNA